MKRLLTSAVALALLASAPAMAQDRDHKGGKHDGGAQAPKGGGGGKHEGGGGGGGKHDGGGGGGGGKHGGGGGGGDRGDYGAPGGGGDHRGGGGADRAGHDGRYDRNPNWNRNNNQNQNWNRNNNQNQNWNRNNNQNQNWNRNNNRNPNWNRNQQRPRNFDRRMYQRNVYAQHRFRGGFYRKPPGWYYRRWSYGQILPFAFFSSSYWLNDYYAYDLPVPPYGYEWVRYGDDAILVDVRTGMILQVMYGVFY